MWPLLTPEFLQWRQEIRSRLKLPTAQSIGSQEGAAAIAQAIRFAVVGLLVALIYFSLFVVLSSKLAPFIANTIAYGLAIVFQYFAQSIWTFARKALNSPQALRFAITMVFAYSVATLITAVVGPAFDWPSHIAAGVVIVILPVTNFIILKLWVFRDR